MPADGAHKSSNYPIPTGVVHVRLVQIKSLDPLRIEQLSVWARMLHFRFPGLLPHGPARQAQSIRELPARAARAGSAFRLLSLLGLGESEGPETGRELSPSGERHQRQGHAVDVLRRGAEATQDWKKVEVVFNSLEEKEVNRWAGIWNGKAGTLWIDDLRLDEIFLVNVLRRDGCPLTVISADGKTVYEEGKDFHPLSDPVFAKHPGHYDYTEPGPEIQLTATSRIRDGDGLLVSWYHPILTHSYQVMCCLSEPKAYDLVRDQIRRVQEAMKPKTYFMSHDEIRVANWCKACQDRKLTPGALLADNVRRCVNIIGEISPNAEIIVWSDMIDPHHNAVKGPYYLVNGPLTNSWEGLPKRVHLANWNGGKAAQSLKFFAERGHGQVIAGFYDDPNPNLDGLKQWTAAAKGVRGVDGFLYTTWQHNFDHLEAYGKALLAN